MSNLPSDQTPASTPTTTPNNQTPPPSTANSSHPEHEPLAFHFGNFKEALSNVEHHESANAPEALPSPLSDQPYTPPIIQTSTTLPQSKTSLNPTNNPHPPLPLSDAEIEKSAHSKKQDDSIHWLALWCIRQLEIYEKGLGKSQ